MGTQPTIMPSEEETTLRTASLTALFNRIDALEKKDDALSKGELTKVFGEHAGEFLKFCDGQAEGAVDQALSLDEFTAGILGDTSDMSQEDFDTNWVTRMTGCVEEAEVAQAAAAPAAEEAAPAAEEAPAAAEEAVAAE